MQCVLAQHVYENPPPSPPPRPFFRDQVYHPQIIVSSIVADVIIMEPSKVKTSTVFPHEEYYPLDIATGYVFQKMAKARLPRTCQERRKGSFRYLFHFVSFVC
jgi:hypothetical protein